MSNVNNKHAMRTRRAQKTRRRIKRAGVEKGTARLVVGRSLNHIYAQVLAPVGGKVLAQASSLELRKETVDNQEGKIGLAKIVGARLAERAKSAGLTSVACDRSGFRYHGRVAALVESVRENGLVV